MRLRGSIAAWLAIVLLPSCSRPARSFFTDAPALPASSDSAEGGSQPMAGELQGEWELVAARVNDESGLTESAVGKPTGKVACAFEGGSLTKWGGKDTKAGIRIDPTKQPMWIDVSWPDGREQKGVFRLSQDSLVLLLSQGERIESLDPGKLDEHYVGYIFKRVERRPFAGGH